MLAAHSMKWMHPQKLHKTLEPVKFCPHNIGKMQLWLKISVRNLELDQEDENILYKFKTLFSKFFNIPIEIVWYGLCFIQ